MSYFQEFTFNSLKLQKTGDFLFHLHEMFIWMTNAWQTRKIVTNFHSFRSPKSHYKWRHL